MFKYNVYKPSLTGNEKKYVDECLDTTWISSRGKFVSKFEEKFSKYIGVNYGTAVCNGTVAIHLALVALGIGEGDEVIVPTFTYIASVNPIVQVGATPVFVDSDEDDWQVSPEDIERKITPKTKAIIAVHLYGHPCKMDKIMEIAKKHNLLVVEDCAEAIGSEFNGKKVGSFGDVACFSFFGNKTMTCGEGGMCLTNDPTIYDRLSRLKGQGLAKFREYWHDMIAFNYRMTNIAAAIGCAQLEQLQTFIDKKQKVASWYKKYLKGVPVKLHEANGKVLHTYWMNSILVEKGQDREELRNFLREEGIETRPTFYPVHTMPMYSVKFTSHKVAEDIALRGINLPSYPALEEEDVKYICDKIREFYGK
ncbi:MAG: DegT/DnrJ/EryC1/StrS family aminotransferase [Alphaproteobacteria bacterium]|nr:DegT/DnrJ/EryC1/StrS family aminotransferase [Alphaproteobacteria bacterium]